MKKRVLITGGAGFVGSHLADELLAHGYAVRALDVLLPQAHPALAKGSRPDYLDPAVELLVGDVCDPVAVRAALAGADAVFHLAAAVGVGQSMYQIANYTRTNNLGTAVLLEALLEARQSGSPIERLIVASSMSIYGEGRYDGLPAAAVRGLEHLKGGEWEMHDAAGTPLAPLPTPEDHPLQHGLQSVYALSKYDQERLCILTGRAYGIPTAALRFFNIYGSRQALGNPYTGVLAIFATRLLAGKPPLINEDGLQRRDFVHARDVALACRLALELPAARLDEDPPVFNIGSGESRTILDVAASLATALGSSTAPEVSGAYRVGDIRHCFADISRAARVLGYRPQVAFADGLAELTGWLRRQPPAEDRGPAAQAELLARGLSIPAARQVAPVA